MAADRMAGRGGGALRLLAGATGRSVIGIAPTGEDGARALAGGDGLPGTQGRTGLGPLRRTTLAGMASSRDARKYGVCLFAHRASRRKNKGWGDDEVRPDGAGARR